MAQAPAVPIGFELPLEARLPRIGAVDAVALEERAASLAKRSIKKDAKVWALLLAIRTTDLTTLEGADTPGKAAAVASKARRPDPSDPSVPPVAAVCVYPNLVPAVRERLAGSGVKVAAVATGFPSGQYPTAVKVADVRATVELGADGIRQAKQAVQHLVVVHETLGPDWLTPDLYRLGASSLLNDILMQLRKERTGTYQSGDYFTLD